MSQAAHVLAVQGTLFIPFHWSPLSFEFVVLVFFCSFYLHKQLPYKKALHLGCVCLGLCHEYQLTENKRESFIDEDNLSSKRYG